MRLEQGGVSPGVPDGPAPAPFPVVCGCGSLLPFQTRLPSGVLTAVPNRFLKLSKCSCLFFVTALLFHFASKQIIHDLLASEVSPNIRSIGSLSLQGCLSPLVMHPLLPFTGTSCCASSSVFHLPWSFGLAPLLILSPRCSSWLISPMPGGS